MKRTPVNWTREALARSVSDALPEWTARDEFAAHFHFPLDEAAKRLMSMRTAASGYSVTVEQAIDEVVRVKYLYADAMLRERAK